MNSFFKALIAGYGAKKLGGGCFSTILIFVLIYVALGQCNKTSNAAPLPAPAKVHAAKHQTVGIKQDKKACNW
ncbi:MAG: hypothetical protein EOP47_26235 [Sphingobacteriaceae bacterium]|nr:MAG: hypothetical protein EOP47_26235 [Sphingobacteriaceae bacterium]